MIGAYITADEVLKTICHRNGDTALSKASIYASFMTTVYNDLRFDVTHKSVIKKLYINKLTNSLPIPDNCLMLQGVGYENILGVVEPLWYNENIPLGLLFDNTKSCNCSTCGSSHTYCSVISSVTDTEEEVEYNGTTYTNTTKTTVLIDGTVIVKKGTWTLINDQDGHDHLVMTLVTTEEELCKVDTLPCGCIADTENNDIAIALIRGCGCENMVTNCGTYNRYIPKEKGYRIDVSESQIILDPSYPLDYIVLRYITTINSAKEYRIPLLALETMVAGIMYYSSSYDKTISPREKGIGGTWYNAYRAEKLKLNKRISPTNFAKTMGAMGVTKTDKCEWSRATLYITP